MVKLAVERQTKRYRRDSRELQALFDVILSL
jgi:hypothetical protein